jgi:membrane protein implicated in regulation of membrane protease activity
MAKFAASLAFSSDYLIRITTTYLIRFQRVIKFLHDFIKKFLWKVSREQGIIPLQHKGIKFQTVMNKNKWSSRILVRYWLLQLPALALLVLILIFAQRWVDLPSWIFWGALAIWVVKDAVLYPFVWRAYDWDHAADTNAMLGGRGTAKERLAPSGYVQVRGELWKAELAEGSQPVEEGEPILVQEIRGLTLIVRPAAEKSE